MTIASKIKAVITSRTPSRQNSRSATPQSEFPQQSPKRTDTLNSVGSSKDSIYLRVEVIQARNLASKDLNKQSDPYIVAQIDDYHEQSHAVQKTLNPVWNHGFEIPIDPTMQSSTLLKLVCWDKDRYGKDYMGEVEITLEDLLSEDREKAAQWYPLVSTMKKKVKISGEIQLNFGLRDPINPGATYSELVKEWKSMLADTSELGSENEDSEVDLPADATPQQKARKRRLRRIKKAKAQKPYEFSQNQVSGVAGIVYFEVISCSDLPPERNVTRTSFDMDPFVIISFGRKTLRTKSLRHTLNPVFNEKMIFQVLMYEQAYTISLRVVDKDKFSSNDFVAEAVLDLKELINTGPTANSETGLYDLPDPESVLQLTKSRQSTMSRSNTSDRLQRAASSNSLSQTQPQKVARPEQNVASSLDGEDAQSSEGSTVIPQLSDSIDYELKCFTLPLNMAKKERWEEKHNPHIKIKARFVPYPALRQQFWRCMFRQYDSDDTGRISRVEMTTMLDTLGSTLTDARIDEFFERYNMWKDAKSKDEYEMTIDQAIICLEEELRKVDATIQSHGDKTPSDDEEDSEVTGESHSMSENSESNDFKPSTVSFKGTETAKDEMLSDDGRREHVIVIRECPLCHQPRLDKRSDTDIITHLATCASQDWRSVDRLVMGDFVTSSQAQRKWYSKVISKVGYGGYKLGANSANILVQDRLTGQIQEERMSVYVRLGIRLFYKGLRSGEMEKKRMRRLLYSLSVKQGRKYDNPLSARDIKSFIAFHKLDMAEVKLPEEQFQTFNQFFYRELKPDARPCTAPDNHCIAVSPADCRCVLFDRVDKATEIWVKGRDFSVARLLGNAYPNDAAKFENGSIGIFRLAPQDYHRFHCPVEGVLQEPKTIHGQYYTVNPMAVRSPFVNVGKKANYRLDVFGENIRVICPIDSEAFGRVMVVCIGAMMVGSTVITAKTGTKISRTQELGYFKFGGSTLVVLFQAGKLKFDDDIVGNSKSSLETLMRVGMSIGHHPQEPSHAPSKKDRDAATLEDRRRASIAIGGSLTPPRGLEQD